MSAGTALLTVAGRPLLTLPHDAATPVRRRVTYPVRAIERRDGSVQRVALGTAPTVEMTYALIGTTVEQASAVLAFLHAAGGDTGHLRVAFPRWEDVIPVAAPGLALDDDAVPIAAGAATHRAFVPGAPVLLLRPNLQFGVGVDTCAVAFLADAPIAADAAALTLAAPAERAWAPGTHLVPIAFGRLAPPRDLSRARPPLVQAALTYTLDDRTLAGDATGDAADGGTAAVPTGIAVAHRGGGNAAGASGVPGGHARFEAVVTDATGLRLTGQPIVWTAIAADHGLGFPITPLVAPLVDPQQVLVSVADTGPYSVAEVVVIATLPRPGLSDLVGATGLTFFRL